MLIPLPLLMWFSTLTGQPVMIYIAPNETPVYIKPTQEIKQPQTAEFTGNCYKLICTV